MIWLGIKATTLVTRISEDTARSFMFAAPSFLTKYNMTTYMSMMTTVGRIA